MSDKKEAAMIANAPTLDLPAAPVAPKIPAGPPHEDAHSGCVRRVLTCRDRNLILSAAQQSAQNGDHRLQRKLRALMQAIETEGSEDYFDAVIQDIEERQRAWAKQKKEWADGKAIEHPGKAPEGDAAAMSGPENTYWVKSSIDAWMLESVKAAKWNPHLNEYVISLLDRLGIKGEE